MKRIILSLLITFIGLPLLASNWTTHFSYNSVNQVAEGDGVVYGVSSGALFSVDTQTEVIRTYSHQDGMHGTNIAYIQWLEQINALMILYADGKVDMLIDGHFKYIPDLYNKTVTFSKHCNSVTLKDSLAYLAMDYGIQTFHIRKQEFVDTYFIGSEATELPVKSIAFANGCIYAATDSALLSASLTDNVVDYRFWSKESLPVAGQIQQIVSVQGVLHILINNYCYARANNWTQVDNTKHNAMNVLNGVLALGDYPAIEHDGIWYAAGSAGVIRKLITGEEITYHLDGPLVNNPYKLCFQQGQLFMVAGGRWAVQNNTPGNVMRYDGNRWHNISFEEIINAVGGYCYDMMNVAVDPADPAHYFVTSYGTGMYEFRDDVCIKRWNGTNSIIGSASLNTPSRYTRLDGAVFDNQGNLWMLNAGDINYNLIVFKQDGEQVGMNIRNLDGSRHVAHTVGEIVFDRRNTQHVWIVIPRTVDGESGLAFIDTKGTIANTEDDDNIFRLSWVDADGGIHTYTAIYAIAQDVANNIWLGTEKGVVIIPDSIDYRQFGSCVVPEVFDESGQNIFAENAVNDIELDHLGQLWIGTEGMGVYVLSPDGKTIIQHYTMENSALPSNTILSLAADVQNKRMYVGSSMGLVAHTDTPDGIMDSYILSDEADIQGSMMQWRTHFAYTAIADLQVTPKTVYAMSEGSLCAIDKESEAIEYFSKMNGLNSSAIQRIDYDPFTRTLLIAYENGMIDLLKEDKSILSVADLYLKQLNTSKQVQDVAFEQGTAYLAMSFGIMALNIQKREISDTYYIGDLGTEISISAVAVLGDSLFAANGNTLYSAHRRSNLVDYSQWNKRTVSGMIQGMVSHEGELLTLIDSVLHCNGHAISYAEKFASMTADKDAVFLYTATGQIVTYEAGKLTEKTVISTYHPNCAAQDGKTYWLGTNSGVLHIQEDLSVQRYEPDGPSSNMPYFLTTYGNRLWAVPGGRWASGFLREGQIMYFDGEKWDNLTYEKICQRMKTTLSLYDIGHIAIDPANPEHFFAASFGSGLIEFYPDGTAKRFNHDNSPLVSLLTNHLRYRYCRVDAIAFDAERNLWLTNTGDLATNMHIIDPQGQWHSFNLYNGAQRIVLSTVSKIMTDQRQSTYKWIASARESAGLILLNDNGTPYRNSDDRVMFRQTFVDQDNKSITLDRLNTIAQDHNGDLWLGTGEGILVIDAATDFFRSNACRRLKISRHDGTNLADYLLGTEQINAIVFAGGNRIWIGTDASGVYLVHMVTKEGIYEPEILEHFTTVNSPMPSDCVLSLAVNEENGEVYIGTAKGLVSYRGDATEPHSDFAHAYVYPNPVRPNFEGIITIAGLMDNTTVYIADAAGNVVCRTHSNGGSAVWDGKTQAGKKAHSGVYTIYCNTADGQGHTVLKVLLMH